MIDDLPVCRAIIGNLTRRAFGAAETLVGGSHAEVQATVDEMGVLSWSTRRIDGVNAVGTGEVVARHAPESVSRRRKQMRKHHEQEEKLHDRGGVVTVDDCAENSWFRDAVL